MDGRRCSGHPGGHDAQPGAATDADTIRSTDGPATRREAEHRANGGAPAEAQESGGESAGTVIVAGVVNLAIAMAKLSAA